MSYTVSKYQEIAADFAEKLVSGHYQVGDKIYARSTLASTYGVSAETARRALAVLADLGVLEVSQGSGAVILSIDKAVEFLRHFKCAASVGQLKNDLSKSIERQHGELNKMEKQIRELSERASLFQEENSFIPYRIRVEANSGLIGKSLSEVNFWHHTGATVVAIGYGEKLVLSPGPFADLREDCTIYYIGPQECVNRVQNFLYE